MKICFHLSPTPLPFIKAFTVNSFVGLFQSFLLYFEIFSLLLKLF